MERLRWALALWIFTATGPLLAQPTGGQVVFSHYLLGNILRRHVHNDAVDYAAIKQDEDLDKYLKVLETTDPVTLRGEPHQVAFWINAYNAFVLKSIVERYPVSSPKSVPGMFKEARHVVGGQKYSLDQIEREILRKRFKEPRVMFVLCPGARGGPDLLDHTLSGYGLIKELDAAAYKFCNDRRFVSVNKIGHKARLSSLFEKYAKDFERFGGVRQVLGTYVKVKADANFLSTGYYETEYIRYDWHLNEYKPKTSR